MRTHTQQTQKNILIATILAFFLLVAIILVLWLFDLRKTATIDILIAPRSANIDIGGKTFQNGTHKIKPGTYEVSITKDGFTPHQATITLESGETANLYTYLLPPDGSYQWYLDNSEDAMILNSIGGHEADITSQAFMNSDPVFRITPFTDPLNNFRINAKQQDNTVSLLIFLNTCSDFSTNLYRTQALRWLEEQGINTADYRIEYSNLCS